MIASLILQMKLTAHGFFREIENEIETEAKALDLSLSNIVEVTHLFNILFDVVDNQFSNQVKAEGVYYHFPAKKTSDEPDLPATGFLFDTICASQFNRN